MPHIREQVAAALVAAGWAQDLDEGARWEKRIAGWAMGGAVCDDGGRYVVLLLDENGRWLERFDQGLGVVEKDVDLRDYPDAPAAAIAAVMGRN